MTLSERIGYLLLGCLIGFALGYVVGYFHEKKEKERGSMSDTTQDNHQKEDGGLRVPRGAEWALLLVVAITVYASFQTARVNAQLNYTLNCITKYNTDNGNALSARDTAIKAGTHSEIELWTQYGRLYAQAKKDPAKIPQVQEKLRQAVASHRDALVETQRTRSQYPYANPNIIENCKEQTK